MIDAHGSSCALGEVISIASLDCHNPISSFYYTACFVLLIMEDIIIVTSTDNIMENRSEFHYYIINNGPFL